MSDAVGRGAPQARSKPPGTKRLRVILSFVCYLLLGLPVWWHTTDIHRAQLSQEAIADTLQQVQTTSLLLPVHLHVYVVSTDRGDPQADARLWLQHLKQQLEQGGWREHLEQGRLQLQVSVESRQDSSCTAVCSTTTGTCSPTTPSSSSSGTGCLLAWKALQQQVPGSIEHELDRLLLDLLSSSQEHHHGGEATTTLGTSTSSSSSDAHGEDAGHYTLFVLPQQVAPSVGTKATSSSSSRSPSGITVGAHRHAWMWELPTSQATTTTVAPAAAAAAAQAARQLLRDFWAAHLGSRRQQGDAGSSSSSSSVGDLPISPAGELLLSFSLLNAGPAAAVFDWQFDQFEQQYLAPLQQVLAPVAGVSVESQVVFYTRAKVNGSWSSSRDAWVVQSADLPFFVDSDWPVEAAGIDTAAGSANNTSTHSRVITGTGTSARPGVSSSSTAEAGAHGAHAGSAASVPAHVLHFLVYIPPPEQQPLLLLGAAGQPSAGNSMWLPSWGGLLVVNPPVKRQGDRTGLLSADDTSPDSSNSNSSSSIEHSPQPGSPWPPSPQQLTRRQQQQIARVVAGQLQALFGLVPAAANHTSHTRGSSSSSSNMSVQQLDPLSTGLSDWQVDQLMTQAVASQVAGAARVLGSLSKLLEELPNLETPDVIGDQVTASLASIQSALQAIYTGDYSAASAAARAARAAAESAFLHPAVLAQLNFPESHKLGVYMPLFLPLCVPVLKGLLLEAKRYMRHRRAWLSSGQ